MSIFGAVEPKAFSERSYDCLRALGLRQRGLSATKDTAVTLALATGREDVMLWLVQQAGVAYGASEALREVPAQARSWHVGEARSSRVEAAAQERLLMH